MSEESYKEERRATAKLYADIARAYLKSKRVYRDHMKKIEDMDDEEVIQRCHCWYVDNGLVAEYREFEDKMLSERS